MKFLLLGDNYKRLFVEDDKQLFSLRYDKNTDKWVDGGMALFDNRYGFDDSEPEGSPYRWGNGSCMEDIVEITKEEAEAFISKSIDAAELEKLLKSKEK